MCTDKLAYERGVELDFSRSGKLTNKAEIESFNGCFRQECPNTPTGSCHRKTQNARLNRGTTICTLDKSEKLRSWIVNTKRNSPIFPLGTIATLPGLIDIAAVDRMDALTRSAEEELRIVRGAISESFH